MKHEILTVNGIETACFNVELDVPTSDFPDFVDAMLVSAFKKVGDEYVKLTEAELASVPSEDIFEVIQNRWF